MPCLAVPTIDTDCRVKVLETAKANILKAQKNQKIAYDRKHSCPQTFQLQALVLKKDFKRKKRKGGKLDCKWVGPYRITADLGHGLYKLECVKNPLKIVNRVNGVHLKKYYIQVRFLLFVGEASLYTYVIDACLLFLALFKQFGYISATTQVKKE